MSLSPTSSRLKFFNKQNKEQYRDNIEAIRQGDLNQSQAELANNDLLRRSTAQVHERALEQHEQHTSPRAFKHVKSKVRGNMSSQKKAKKNN
mgnify:CR=1 FL=1